MMGHMAGRVLAARHDVFGTIRGKWTAGSDLARFLDREAVVEGVDTARLDSVTAAIGDIRPDVLLNCVGLVKQRAESKDAVLAVETNSLLPHRLSLVCSAAGARLIHLSTDCVFSGRGGPYTQESVPDPVDLYGRSKLLGETPLGPALTLRTSIVGRQLTGHTSLFDWVLSQRGCRVRGFRRALYTGLTTEALARVIGLLIENHPGLSGVWQVASDPINKYELVCELSRRLGLEMTVDADDDFFCDRRLDGKPFESETGITVPSWQEMLDDFVADQHWYADVDPGWETGV
jgi:dTDP-4-dehydrorhamnose reductase